MQIHNDTDTMWGYRDQMSLYTYRQSEVLSLPNTKVETSTRDTSDVISTSPDLFSPRPSYWWHDHIWSYSPWRESHGTLPLRFHWFIHFFSPHTLLLLFHFSLSPLTFTFTPRSAFRLTFHLSSPLLSSSLLSVSPPHRLFLSYSPISHPVSSSVAVRTVSPFLVADHRIIDQSPPNRVAEYPGLSPWSSNNFPSSLILALCLSI